MLETQICMKIWFQLKADFSVASSVIFDFIMDEKKYKCVDEKRASVKSNFTG